MEDGTFDQELTGFMTVVGLLTRRVRTAASHDLSWTQTTVLARLAQDGPATAAELARAEGVKPQSMATTVAELSELGLVERTPHPTDGRQMLVVISAAGTAFRKEASDKKRTWMAQALAQLDENDRKTVFAAAKILRRLVEL